MCGITYNEVRGAKQSRDVMMELREGHNPGKRYKYVTQKKSRQFFGKSYVQDHKKENMA